MGAGPQTPPFSSCLLFKLKKHRSLGVLSVDPSKSFTDERGIQVQVVINRHDLTNGPTVPIYIYDEHLFLFAENHSGECLLGFVSERLALLWRVDFGESYFDLLLIDEDLQCIAVGDVDDLADADRLGECEEWDGEEEEYNSARHARMLKFQSVRGGIGQAKVSLAQVGFVLFCAPTPERNT